jgi:AcrR family transcriptional regulator
MPARAPSPKPSALLKRRRGGRAPPLTREAIVEAALGLIAREGLGGFSLRNLGRALRCEAMSLYHLFPSKQHLVDGLVDHAIASMPAPDAKLPPRERLRRIAHDYRAMSRRYPQLFSIIAVHRLNTPTGVAFIERTLRVAREVTGDDESAARLFRTMGYYLMGTGLDETSGYAKGPSAAEPVDGAYIARECPQLARSAKYFAEGEWDATFDAGLAALLGPAPAMRKKKLGGKAGTRRRR